MLLEGGPQHVFLWWWPVKRNIWGGISGLINNGGSRISWWRVQIRLFHICCSQWATFKARLWWNLFGCHLERAAVTGSWAQSARYPDSFRFFVQYITWRAKSWADEVGSMQMARDIHCKLLLSVWTESVANICQSNLSRKGQNKIPRLWILMILGACEYVTWLETTHSLILTGPAFGASVPVENCSPEVRTPTMPFWCDCCCLLRCQQPH